MTPGAAQETADAGSTQETATPGAAPDGTETPAARIDRLAP